MNSEQASPASTLGLILESGGYPVSLAENGREALDHLEAHSHPQLILLGLMRPKMNGWEFNQARTASLKIRGIPTVVLSTAAGVMPTEVDGLMSKPFEMDPLIAMVKKTLQVSGDTSGANVLLRSG